MTGPEYAPINIVLDASAIVAYTRSSVHVGEVLTELDDEDAVAALPVACLVEAYRLADNRNLLRLLVDHPATVLLAEAGEGWQDLAGTYLLTGRYDTATAARAAISLDVAVLTRYPAWYAGVDEGGLVIPIED